MVFELHFDTDKVNRAHPEPPPKVAPESTVGDVLQLLEGSPQGYVLVEQDGTLLGIFTERDAIRLMADGLRLDARIDSVMVRDVATLEAEDTVETAISRMAHRGYRRLPIKDASGSVSAVLSANHVLHYLVEHIPAAIYNLPPQPRQSHTQREGA